jgi:hypothetical protein
LGLRLASCAFAFWLPLSIGFIRMTKATLTIQQLDINSIRCEFSNIYEPELVNAIARSIIETGGLAIPLVVTRNKAGFYDVEEGVLAYYGAVKAYEINPRNKLVNTCIINAAAKIPVWNQIQLINTEFAKK